MDIKELAEKIKNSDVWVYDDCKALCYAAGLGKEWDAANGENFENVIYKAAKILEVDI